MNANLDFDPNFVDKRTPADLRQTETMKWNMFPEDHIGAFVAEMDLGTAPAIQKALHALVDQEAYGYMPTRFSRDLSEACSRWQHDINHWEVPAEQIFPIVDVISALEHTITHFSSPGSPVIVPTPAYMPFLTIPPAMNREVVEVPMLRGERGRWELDLEGIGRAFNDGAELLILCNPQNPTGRVHDAEELRALAEVVDQHGARVFSDEIHSPLVYPGHTHIPYASLSKVTAGHTITATATSKAWNTPGLKCAQVIISNDVDLEKWTRVAGMSMYGASNFGVVGSTAAYDNGRQWLSGALEYLDRNRMLMAEILSQEIPSVKYDPPDGTYLAWLDFREIGLGDAPGQVLKEQARVVVSDGPAFGEIGRGWLRLNFAMPTPLLEEALRRMVAFTKGVL